MAYLGATRGRKLMAELKELGIGQATQPYEKPPGMNRPWFLDNGAYANWRAGRPLEAQKFMRSVEASVHEDPPPDFIVVPDRVADREETMKLWRVWIPRLAGMGPLYVVAQDGMDADDLELSLYVVPDVVRGVFIGGTNDFKFANGKWIVRWSHERGLKCHIGRIGTENKVRWAKYIGADSIDSSAPLWSKQNLNRFLRGLNTPLLFNAH